MATAHLKIDGIDGDSTATGFEDQIDCTSWSWGASQAANMHISSGGASAGSNVMDVSITKDMDKSSPNLMKKCCAGEHIPEAILTCTKSAGTGGMINWYVITMTEVIISSVSSSGQEGAMGMESVSLNFAKYKIEFFSQGADGTAQAGPEATWDIRAQVE
ncbi:MAG: type VI secretion system tube protein Hcp [Xanthomonadales bacterium]|nr:type VI secretion system tube protein Hcp [Xanthomonadales bacterium]